MACEICGRSDCTRCFHSIEEQERFDEEQIEEGSKLESEARASRIDGALY